MGSTQWELTPGCDGDSPPPTYQCPPPPCDGPALSNGVSIRINGTAITAAGTHPSAGSNSEIIVLLDGNFDTAVNSVVLLLPSSAT